MTKKQDKNQDPEEMTVIFVEGDADELIVNRLLDYYKSLGWQRPSGVRVVNTHGTPIERKMKQGLERIRQCCKKSCSFRAVCCEYDTDIYEKQIQQKPNWKKVERDLKSDFGVVEFCRLEAKPVLRIGCLMIWMGCCGGFPCQKTLIPKEQMDRKKLHHYSIGKTSLTLVVKVQKTLHLLSKN